MSACANKSKHVRKRIQIYGAQRQLPLRSLRLDGPDYPQERSCLGVGGIEDLFTPVSAHLMEWRMTGFMTGPVPGWLCASLRRETPRKATDSERPNP